MSSEAKQQEHQAVPWLAQHGIRQAVLVRPLRIAKDTIKCVEICLLDPTQSGLERLAYIRGYLPHIPPVAVVWNLKAIIFREESGLLLTTELLQSCGVFIVMNVREPLEEHQWKNVRFEICGIHRPAKDVRGLPKMGFKLGECNAQAVKCVCGKFLSWVLLQIRTKFAARLLLKGFDVGSIKLVDYLNGELLAHG